MLTSAQAIHDYNDQNGNYSDKNDKFEFNNGSFNYVVDFTQNQIGSDKEPVSSIKIVCTHIEEFYTWSCTTSDRLKEDTDADNMESGRTKSVINYDPDLLYNVLLGHKNGNLDKIYTINFPEKFKIPEVPLVVEITSRIPYTNENNVAKLYLKPIPIDEVERCGHKFLRMNKLGKEEHNARIIEQDVKITDQDTRIQHLEELVRKMSEQILILTEKSNKSNT